MTVMKRHSPQRSLNMQNPAVQLHVISSEGKFHPRPKLSIDHAFMRNILINDQKVRSSSRRSFFANTHLFIMFPFSLTLRSGFCQLPILRDLPHALRVKLAYDTHGRLLNTLTMFQGLDVAVIMEMVYRLKPMQIRRKVMPWNFSRHIKSRTELACTTQGNQHV